MNEDPALEFRRMYLAHCEACERAGIPALTIDEWIRRIEERITERQEEREARH